MAPIEWSKSLLFTGNKAMSLGTGKSLQQRFYYRTVMQQKDGDGHSDPKNRKHKPGMLEFNS